MTAGSGTPYSRQSNITAEELSGINDRKILDGSLNGSRLPWNFRMSAKLDKTFKITDKSSLNFYVQVNNLLNAKNINLISQTELIAEELRLAINEIGRLTGAVDVEEYLEVIFRDFCIGK